MNSNKVVVLFSGGADSRLLLELALQTKEKIHCVLIDYQQLHNKELDVAKKILDSYLKYGDGNKLTYQEVSLSGLNLCSALTGDGEKGRFGDQVSSWHVPARNIMFISIAASIAENLGFDLIWYGADYSDREGLFPDCYQDWVFKVNELLKINGSRPISLEAPLLGFSKQLVINYLESLGISKDSLFSGYGKLENN